MGRSGGRNKLTEKSSKTRGQLSLFSDTKIKKRVINDPKTIYEPGTDHEDLLLDAIELWIQDPSIILENESLLEKERNRFLNGDYPPEKQNQEYWARALEALLHQVKNDKPESTPIFRGQPFFKDHPLDRVRGWSSDMNIAADFIEIMIENDNAIKEIRKIDSSTYSLKGLQDYVNAGGDIFKNNGRVVTSVYVIDDPEHGFSINGSFLREKRTSHARDKFKEGKFIGAYYTQDPETGKWEWDKELLDLALAKEEAVQFIIKKIDSDRIARDLDVEGSSQFEIRQAIFELSTLEDVSRYLKEIGNDEFIDYWESSVRSGNERLNQSRDFYYTKEEACYLNENEVIVAPETIKKVRRVEVVLAESKEELLELKTELIAEKMELATKTQTGTNPETAAPGQKTIFD